MKLNRRMALRSALLGGGLVGLKALATGLPTSVFTEGLSGNLAYAAEPTNPKFLLLITMSAGDPFNANVPGTYVDGVVNNQQADMAETSLRLGEVETSAAAPWATLPQWVLDRTAFIHHRTYQNAHPQYQKVMGLVGSAKNSEGNGSEHIASLIASELAPSLATVQTEPVALGSAGLTFRGAQLQSIKPSTLAEIFKAPDEAGLELARIRDEAIDDLYAIAKQDGTRSQLAWIDRYVTSRRQASELDASLTERFATIEDDSPLSQVRAALTLFMMRLTSVATVAIPFGGDSHFDDGLVRERDQTVAALQTLNTLWSELENHPLRDQVVVANLSVFGRTLKKKGTKGRDHNLNHHAMMISGAGVGAGVYGALEPSGNDFGSMSIDSATGVGVPDDAGDIPRSETLESASKTLAAILGVPGESIEKRIDGGTIIAPAVASS